ncbi:MAG: ABC transporter ATP-binding protein [Chloroflexota bacterium]|nr:ABC transporter ATP-binding protein [Chloroflexota bacterium]MDE2929420.1 ABC transporter ATP-binding protein [Chloroflexota bacterium]
MVALVVVSTGVSLISPLLLKRLFDEAIPAGDIALIVPLLVGIIVFPLLAMALVAAQNYLRAGIGEAVSQSLRQALFNHVLYVRMKDLEQVASGRIIRAVTKICGEIGEVYVSNELLPMFTNALLLLGTLGVMLYLNSRLLLVSLVIFPISYLFARRMYAYAEGLDGELHQSRDKAMTYLQDVMPGMRTVRAHTAEPYESARWLAWIKADWQIKARTVTFHNLVRTLPMDLIQHFGVGLVYGFGAYEVISGRLSIGGLVAFIIYVPRAYVALETILDGYIATGQAKAAAERIDSLLGLPREVDQTVHASTGSARTDASAPAAARNEAGRLGAAIEFSNVSFDYGREGFGLEDVSFQIEPGAFVGVVGPSGGGKSTIIDLLLRFYEPRSGEIRVDGKDIESLPLSHLRQMIGLVPQDVFLWNDSIYANLVYPSRRVPREQLIAAAKAAQFHGFVESLPEGYETPVGERGLALSGGERQRLSLCRAILEEPHILLLDEATSALDSLIEREIRAALERARQGRTTLVVAHRLVTVMKADKILVLDEGRLVQEGTPQELLAQPGLFQDLYEAQRL